MLSRNRSSVLPLLLLKLLLCMSCLQGRGRHSWLHRSAVDWGSDSGHGWESSQYPREGARSPSQEAAPTWSGEKRCLTSELKRSSSSEDSSQAATPLLSPWQTWPIHPSSSLLLHPAHSYQVTRAGRALQPFPAGKLPSKGSLPPRPSRGSGPPEPTQQGSMSSDKLAPATSLGILGERDTPRLCRAVGW